MKRRAAPALCGLSIGGLILSAPLRADEPPLSGPPGAFVATEVPGSRAAREPGGRASGAAAPCARFAARSFVAAFAVALRRTVRRSRRHPPLARQVRGLECEGLLRSCRVTRSPDYYLSVGALPRPVSAAGKPANSSARRPFAPRPTPGRVPRPPRKARRGERCCCGEGVAKPVGVAPRRPHCAALISVAISTHRSGARGSSGAQALAASARLRLPSGRRAATLRSRREPKLCGERAFIGPHRRRDKPANSAARRPNSPASHPLAAPDGAPIKRRYAAKTARPFLEKRHCLV